MITRICTIVLAFVPLAAWAQGPPDLKADARLGKPVSERLKIVPVKEALADLSKQVGVPVEVAANISDLKVTVLVEKEPGSQVMAKIGSVLDANWTYDGTTYRLVMDASKQNRLRQFLEKEDKVLRADAEAMAKRLVQDASSPSGGSGELGVAAAPERYLIGRLFATWGPADWQAFWNGRVAAVSMPAAALGRVPRRPGPDSPGAEAGTVAQRRQRIQAFAMYNPTTQTIEIKGQLGQTSASTLPDRPLIRSPFPTGALAEDPTGKEILAWAGGTPDERQQKAGAAPALKPSEYSNHLWSMADHLEGLFEATKVPIVADAFRVPIRLRNPIQASTPSQWIAALVQAEPSFVRFEDGFIMLRHGGFWRLRRMEVPESTLRPLEAKASKGNLTLSDYADFAAKLTMDQEQPFRAIQTNLVRFDAAPLAQAFPALRFFATLGVQQRNAALAGTPIDLGHMNATQRTAFALAVLRGAFADGQILGNFARALENPEALASNPNLGFLVTQGDATSPTGQLVPSIRMLFGASERDGVLFSLPTAQRKSGPSSP